MIHQISITKFYFRLCGDKIFSTIKLFNDHNEEKHTPATCNICNEEFKSKHKLALHMKNTHNRQYSSFV